MTKLDFNKPIQAYNINLTKMVEIQTATFSITNDTELLEFAQSAIPLHFNNMEDVVIEDITNVSNYEDHYPNYTLGILDKASGQYLAKVYTEGDTLIFWKQDQNNAFRKSRLHDSIIELFNDTIWLGNPVR